MPRKTPIAKAASVQAGNARPRVTNTVAAPGGHARVPHGRPEEPGEQLAEGAGHGDQHDRDQHQPGQRGPDPAEALRPGVPERAGLQFPGQHRGLPRTPRSARAPGSSGSGRCWPSSSRYWSARWPGSRRPPRRRRGRRPAPRSRDAPSGPSSSRNSATTPSTAGTLTSVAPVLPPGDPDHPPPGQRRQPGVLAGLRGQGAHGHRATSVGSRTRGGRRARRHGRAARRPQVRQDELLQADRVRLPARRHRLGRPAGPDQQVGLRGGPPDLHDRHAAWRSGPPRRRARSASGGRRAGRRRRPPAAPRRWPAR